MKFIKKTLGIVKRHRDAFSCIAGLSLYLAIAIIFKLPCPIKFITGISCPGCGMTRALIALITLDFSSALYYHPLVFLLIPTAVALWIFSKKRMLRTRKVFCYVICGLMIATYLVRFIVLRSPVLDFDPKNGIFLRIILKLFGS